MLSKVLNDKQFLNIYIHGKMEQEQRIKHYEAFKSNEKRILVSTDLFGRGIDIERVNMVINFDMPEGKDPKETYMHRVGRAGRFETKGISISFLSTVANIELNSDIQ